MEQFIIDAKAQELWDQFNESEQHGVRFGMFPAGPMTEAEKQGYDGRLLALALMNCAKADGGMIA